MPKIRTYAAVFITALAGAAQAATITFDAAPNGTYLTAPFSESGFDMSLDTGHYDIYDGGTDETHHVNIDTDRNGPAKISFVQDGGGAFNLTSFDVMRGGGGGADFVQRWLVYNRR